MNYKAEINKIRDLYYVGDITGEQLTESILHLFREIAKEVVPKEKETWQEYQDGWNDCRSEILSNIEKVIT